jgi:hypothetical protein
MLRRSCWKTCWKTCDRGVQLKCPTEPLHGVGVRKLPCAWFEAGNAVPAKARPLAKLRLGESGYDAIASQHLTKASLPMHGRDHYPTGPGGSTPRGTPAAARGGTKELRTPGRSCASLRLDRSVWAPF